MNLLNYSVNDILFIPFWDYAQFAHDCLSKIYYDFEPKVNDNGLIVFDDCRIIDSINYKTGPTEMQGVDAHYYQQIALWNAESIGNKELITIAQSVLILTDACDMRNHKDVHIAIENVLRNLITSDSIKRKINCDFRLLLNKYGAKKAYRNFLHFDNEANNLEQIELKVLLTKFTPSFYSKLVCDPKLIYELSDDDFELLIAERFTKMGLEVVKVGNTRRKDGGIDIIAWPQKQFPFPFLIAAQVKHHHDNKIMTGSPVIRDFYGVLTSQNSLFNLGIVVTNTSFTPDAKWFAEKNRRIIRLRDLNHLISWIKNDFSYDYELMEIPSQLEIAKDIIIPLNYESAPKSLF